MIRRAHGFSLVELAVVLVIVGLLIGGLLTPLQMQFEQARVSETERGMEQAREALLGYAIRNGYLPCPAISAQNGLEDRQGARCRGGKRQGLLPWATLGVAKLDGWGRVYRYSVTPAFADSQALFDLKTKRDITIGTRDRRGRIVAASAVNDIPAVVMSHGRNGFGGFSDAGIRNAGDGRVNRDERTNAAARGTGFITRVRSDNPAAPGGEFDDMVSWISPNVLFNRMVGAGTLPR